VGELVVKADSPPHSLRKKGVEKGSLGRGYDRRSLAHVFKIEVDTLRGSRKDVAHEQTGRKDPGEEGLDHITVPKGVRPGDGKIVKGIALLRRTIGIGLERRPLPVGDAHYMKAGKRLEAGGPTGKGPRLTPVINNRGCSTYSSRRSSKRSFNL